MNAPQKPPPPMPLWKRALALVPHGIRAVALSLAAFSLALGLTSTAGLVSAMLGATVGVLGGQRLASSRFKLSLIVGALFAALLLTWGFAKACVAYELVPTILGPALTLSLVEVLRFAVLPAAVCAMMRSSAVRRPTLVGLELGFVAVAVTSVFAAHREGVISRPLWLADWAFRNDVDPARLILAAGFAAAFILATLLLVETRSGRAVSSLVVLVALGVVGLLTIKAVGLPKPQPLVEAGRTDEQGEEPPPPPPGDGGGGQDPTQKDGGGGVKPQYLDGGGGSSASDGGAQDGGGTPPPSPPSRLTEDPSNGGGSPQPVAVVIFADDYSPPSQAYYFRQEAMSQWNGTRFVGTGRGDADRDGVSTFPTEKTTVPEPPSAKGRVLVHHTVALLTEHTNPFGLEGPVSFAPAKNPNPRFIRAYKVESLAQETSFQKLLGRPSGDPKWSPELRSYYTLGPPDPRYAELANKFVLTLPEKVRKDPFAMALAVKTNLDHELTYSTKVKYASSGDPTAGFLFGKKVGYCVHFAHAAVLLWRSLGIPSRVAAGYHADEDNRKGGSALIIKGSDAHMWPELYLEGIGWIVLDIAAEKNLDPPGTPQDEDLQRLLGNMARDESPDPEQPARPPPRHYGRDAGIAGGSLLLLAALVLYATKIWRRFAPTIASSRALPRVGYRAALDMLAEVGLARTFGESREAFAERAAAAAPTFREITQMHVAARLRDPQTPIAARTELARTSWMPALARLRSDLSAHTRAGRRILGILNPASFFASR